MANSISWDDFRLIQAIATAKSLVGAAQTLGLNHSTLFRRLGALEEALGTALFERARTGYVPTAAGEEMIALASHMADDISQFERRIAGRDVKPAGELRVTTNDTFAEYLLTPVFTAFRAAYPDITLNVIVSNETLNLSKRDADVAIRATEEPTDTLVGRRIAHMGWARYAPKSWVEDGRIVDESKVPWIGFGESYGAQKLMRWLGEQVEPQAIVYKINSFNGAAKAIAAGVGMGALPCFIGDQLTDTMQRVGEPIEADAAALWLLTHADLRHSARVRAFMDHVGGELMKLRKLLEG